MQHRVLCTAIVLAFGPALVVGQSSQEPAALQKSCDDGNARACSDLGLLYTKGEGVPKDAARAAQLYQKACDAGRGVPLER